MMDEETARRLIVAATDGWLADPESDVVWTGDHEDRRAVRMRQTVRDLTTVWFSVDQRTVTVEAFVLPLPEDAPGEAIRHLLRRNFGTRRLHFALDPRNDLVVTGRISLSEVSQSELELVLGEVYDLIESSFRHCLRRSPPVPDCAKNNPGEVVDTACAQPPVDCCGYVDDSASHTRSSSGIGQITRSTKLEARNLNLIYPLDAPIPDS